MNSWTSSGPNVGGATLLTIDPTNPLRFYVAASTQGILTSEDGGAKWDWTSLTDHSVFSMAVDPTSPNIVYAATSVGIWKSLDYGAHWEIRSNGLSVAFSTSVVLDPLQPTTLYVGTIGGGVFRSTDGAASWAETGLRYYSDVRALIIAGSDPPVLYAGTVGAVFKSLDAGATWTRAFEGLATFHDLAVDPDNPALVFAAGSSAIYRSADAGATWEAASTGIPEGSGILDIEPSRDPSGSTYVTTYPGLYRCDGRAESCGFVSSVAAWRIVESPAEAGVLFSATPYGGVLRSTDRGSTWLPLGIGFSAVGVWSLATDGGSTYAATELGMYRRVQLGSWLAVNRGLEQTSLVQALGVDPWQPETAYVGAQLRCPSAFPCIAGGGIFKTTNSGESWEPAGETRSDRPLVIAADRWNPGVLYAGTDYNVLKSVDHGDSWTTLSNVPGAYSLALSAPSTVYAGTLRGIYRSTDGGASWQRVGLAKYHVVAVATRALNTLEVYAGTGIGVFKSMDGGLSWQQLTGFGRHSVSSLALNPTKPNIVYAGTLDAGVFRTTDGGMTWNELNDGLPDRRVRTVAIDDSGTRLSAGTYTEGVFDYVFAPKLPILQLPASFRIPSSSSP